MFFNHEHGELLLAVPGMDICPAIQCSWCSWWHVHLRLLRLCFFNKPRLWLHQCWRWEPPLSHHQELFLHQLQLQELGMGIRWLLLQMLGLHMWISPVLPACNHG